MKKILYILLTFCILFYGCAKESNSVQLASVENFMTDHFETSDFVPYSSRKYGTTLKEGVSVSIVVDPHQNVSEIRLAAIHPTEASFQILDDFIHYLPELVDFQQSDLDLDQKEIRIEESDYEIVYLNQKDSFSFAITWH